jgi:DNA-binding GntR family transcriptional regulator
MIDALSRRNAQGLQDVLLQHLHNKRQVVMAQLQNN